MTDPLAPLAPLYHRYPAALTPVRIAVPALTANNAGLRFLLNHKPSSSTPIDPGGGDPLRRHRFRASRKRARRPGQCRTVRDEAFRRLRTPRRRTRIACPDAVRGATAAASTRSRPCKASCNAFILILSTAYIDATHRKPATQLRGGSRCASQRAKLESKVRCTYPTSSSPPRQARIRSNLPPRFTPELCAMVTVSSVVAYLHSRGTIGPEGHGGAARGARPSGGAGLSRQ
jgi:hypothetical protein